MELPLNNYLMSILTMKNQELKDQHTIIIKQWLTPY